MKGESVALGDGFAGGGYESVPGEEEYIDVRVM